MALPLETLENLYAPIFLVFMFILGAVLGSFACCQARRLRRKETGKKPLGSRSVCESCGHQLRWFENLPLLSWLLQKGRCKKCHKKIGNAEFLAELGSAVAFLALGLKFWPSLLAGEVLAFVRLGLIIVLITSYLICFVYDALWKRLPTAILWFAVVISGIYCGLRLFAPFNWLGLLAGLGVLPGVYFLLYFFSREKLVGSGDWILALSVALTLGSFKLSLLTLFLSNFLACLVMLPPVVMRKRQTKKIAFGPFLIVAFLVVFYLDWAVKIF